MKNIFDLQAYYRDEKKWSAGPHLFIDDKQIWVFTPLTLSGVHSPSYNKLSLGVEMLGDFASEPFTTGRGEAVRRNAIAAIATLSAVLGLDPAKMKLHKEDPGTTHYCPGAHVNKADFIADVQTLMRERHLGEHVV